MHSKIVDIDRWNKLLLNSEGASFFQSPEFVTFVSQQNELDTFVLECTQCPNVGVSGYIQAEGSLLKKFFTKRAIIHGGLVVDAANCSASELAVFLSQLIHTIKAKKPIYLEIRNYAAYSAWKEVFLSAGFQYIPHLNIHISLQNKEAAYKGLSASKRRQIKLAKQSGAIYEKSLDSSYLNAFYDVLEDLYQHKIKKPLFSRSFFEQLIKLDSCQFFVVLYQDQVIGGSICLSFNQQILYEWFVCGMDTSFPDCYPSVLATWAGIEYAASKGFKTFDMMGAGTPDQPYGVRDFKLRFGGELVEHGRFILVYNPWKYWLGLLIQKILKNVVRKF